MRDKTPYGPKSNVAYADPGLQPDGIARYPIDTTPHIRAALAYINVARNADKYSPEQLKSVKKRIYTAAKEHGIDVSSDADELAHTPGHGLMAQEERRATLLASVAPLLPPAPWFQDPALTAPTKLTITDDGRVFGHLALWRMCHVGIGNRCVIAPKSQMDYRLFKVGTVRTSDGGTADVGKITLGTGHAHEQWGVVPSREHYDNTGWAAAIVNVGEDPHGIWVAGSLTTQMTPERIAEFRAAGLSGDWRQVDGNLELIAALAVNNPGFPVYREAAGRAFSLTAVGIVGQEEDNMNQFAMADDDEDLDEVDDATADEDEEGDEDLDEEDEDDADEDEGEEDEEFAARVERLAIIDEEFAEMQAGRRAAQLARIDEARGQVGSPVVRSRR